MLREIDRLSRAANDGKMTREQFAFDVGLMAEEIHLFFLRNPGPTPQQFKLAARSLSRTAGAIRRFLKAQGWDH